MKKIPVSATIQAAYLFVFRNLGAIIGLIWLPMVIITVVGFFVMQRYYAVAADAFASNAYGRMGPVILSVFCFMIAKLLFTAVMSVPLVQLALGQRKDATLVHFAFGPAEWRLFRSMIGLAAFLMVPAIFAGIVTNLTLAPAASKLVVELGSLALMLLLGGIIYVGLRFVFLLPAVAVTEEGPLLPRCWKLSTDNFWRIAAILIACLGPVIFLAALAEMALSAGGSGMPSLTNSSAQAAAQLNGIGSNMPISQGLGFLIAPFTLGLFCSASAFALAALKDNGRTDLTV